MTTANCNNNVDKMCLEVEQWLDPGLFKELNESIGGVRQLWKENQEHQAKFVELARGMKLDIADMCNFSAKNSPNPVK